MAWLLACCALHIGPVTPRQNNPPPQCSLSLVETMSKQASSFLKKEAKNFCPFCGRWMRGGRQVRKVFLVLFFQKKNCFLAC
jgi:hypothetical protein